MLNMSDLLAPLPLRSLTIKRVKDLRIATQRFLHGLHHLSAVAIEDTKIPVIPSFSFSTLENIFSITFKKAEIGTISSDAFSDLKHLRYLRFINCTIGDIEHNAFGRGKNRIANLILEESDVETIHEDGIWLDDADIVHIDKCNIRKIIKNAIKLHRVFYFYLTRSIIGNCEPGGISGGFFSGVMIDNDIITPGGVDIEDSRPLLDLHQLKIPGSVIAPFFHFTSNVITRIIPGHAFFITNPTINVAVPNNTLGECSCTEYRSFLHSLRLVLDEYTLNVHQALLNHGVCLVSKEIYSIGCPNLILPLSIGVWSRGTRPPLKKMALRSTTKPATKTAQTQTAITRTTTTKPPMTQRPLLFQPTPHLTTTTTITSPPTSKPAAIITPVHGNVKLQNKAFAVNGNKTSNNITERPMLIGKPTVPSVLSTSDPDPGPSEAPVFPPAVPQPKQDRPSTLAEDLSSLDLQTIWNEIYGGVFALRLRKPLPDSFPRSPLSVKFKKVMKPIEWQRFQGRKFAVVSPR